MTTSDDSNRPKTGESVRVPVRRVHGLLDVVGEAELEARRVERGVLELTGLAAEHVRVVAGDPPADGDRHLCAAGSL